MDQIRADGRSSVFTIFIRYTNTLKSFKEWNIHSFLQQAVKPKSC